MFIYLLLYKWIVKLQSLRWGIWLFLLVPIKGPCANRSIGHILRLQGLNPFGTLFNLKINMRLASLPPSVISASNHMM